MAFKRSAVRSRLSPPRPTERLVLFFALRVFQANKQQRFDPAYLHQKVLKSYDFRTFSCYNPEICQIKGRFSKHLFFHVASVQLPMPEFGLNSLKSCCTPNFSVIHLRILYMNTVQDVKKMDSALSFSRSMPRSGSMIHHRSSPPPNETGRLPHGSRPT